MYTLEDAGGTLTLDDVAALPDGPEGFTPTRRQQWNKPLTRSAIWLRLDLSNDNQESQTLRLVLGPRSFDQQDVYLPTRDGWVHLPSGLTRPRPSQPQASRRPSIEMELPPQSQQRVYLRLHGQQALRLDPKLYSHTAYEQAESRAQLIDGILLGSFLLFSLGVLMTAALTRSRPLAFLGILWLTTAFYEIAMQGYGKLYLWPQSTTWGALDILFLGHSALALSFLLCLSLAKTQRLKVPKRWLQAAALLEITLAIAPFLANAYIVNQIAAFTLPICALILLTTAFCMVKQKPPCHKLILLLAILASLVLTLWAAENMGVFSLANLPNAARLSSLSTNPLLSLTGLILTLATVTGWLQHVVRQRDEAAGKLIAWQEQEQTRLYQEIATHTSALRRALQYADEKNREKTEILSYIGHDLRAPLASISG